MTSNNGTTPDVVFVLGNASNVFGMQQALVAAGYAGPFTNQIQYSPNLVAPATGAFVPTQTAAGRDGRRQPGHEATGRPTCRRSRPTSPSTSRWSAGYWSADLFLAAVQKAGKNLTPASLEKAANAKFTYEVAKTVGPTTFPAAHSLPTPCGALVQSNGTAYTVKVPYTCGRVVKIK